MPPDRAKVFCGLSDKLFGGSQVARKYYHAKGKTVVKGHHDGTGQVFKLIASCPSEEMAAKVAEKLTRCDDYEYILRQLAEQGNRQALRGLIDARGLKGKNNG